VQSEHGPRTQTCLYVSGPFGIQHYISLQKFLWFAASYKGENQVTVGADRLCQTDGGPHLRCG
jgi:hypothetical protein